MITATPVPALPGAAVVPAPRRTLVVAPHGDDEVLGPGGLVAQTVAGGAPVEVLFLTDSGGAGPDPDRRAVAAARRREESTAAARVLGIPAGEVLGVPDGTLDRHVGEAAAAIRDALLAHRPERLLVPAPTERSADHRATFAALHRVLAPLRDDDPLLALARELEIWLYEVNHPGFPDRLVDVSAQVPTLERAMACYASQEAERPYLAAALGLRRYRTVTLPPGPTAVEAYRVVAVDDLRTRSLAGAVAWLGGTPERVEVEDGPAISVVVRTRDRAGLLAEALGSVAASTYRRLELVLVNDGGATPEVPSDFPFPVVRVELSGRGRAAAANAGIAAATAPYVAFLDDDDRVEPEHFAVLAGAVVAGIEVPYSDAAVCVHELAGDRWELRERRLPYSRDFDRDLLLLDNYIPFPTILLPKARLAEVGPLDESFAFFEDWELLVRMSRVVPFRHLREVTCEYRVFRGAGHHVLGDEGRRRGDFLAAKARVFAKHAAALTPEAIAGGVDALRTTAVDAGEAAAAARRERREVEEALAASRREVARLQGEELRLAGDVARYEAAVAALQATIAGLHEEGRSLREQLVEVATERGRLAGVAESAAVREAELGAALDERGARLTETFAEIERLNRLVATMQSTRAWRLHRTVERWRGR